MQEKNLKLTAEIEWNVIEKKLWVSLDTDGGVKVLSEKMGFVNFFMMTTNYLKWIGIHDLQIRFDSISVFNIVFRPAIRTGQFFRYEKEKRVMDIYN